MKPSTKHILSVRTSRLVVGRWIPEAKPDGDYRRRCQLDRLLQLSAAGRELWWRTKQSQTRGRWGCNHSCQLVPESSTVFSVLSVADGPLQRYPEVCSSLSIVYNSATWCRTYKMRNFPSNPNSFSPFCIWMRWAHYMGFCYLERSAMMEMAITYFWINLVNGHPIFDTNEVCYLYFISLFPLRMAFTIYYFYVDQSLTFQSIKLEINICV